MPACYRLTFMCC